MIWTCFLKIKARRGFIAAKLYRKKCSRCWGRNWVIFYWTTRFVMMIQYIMMIQYYYILDDLPLFLPSTPKQWYRLTLLPTSLKRTESVILRLPMLNTEFLMHSGLMWVILVTISSNILDQISYPQCNFYSNC